MGFGSQDTKDFITDQAKDVSSNSYPGFNYLIDLINSARSRRSMSAINVQKVSSGNIIKSGQINSLFTEASSGSDFLRYQATSAFPKYSVSPGSVISKDEYNKLQLIVNDLDNKLGCTSCSTNCASSCYSVCRNNCDSDCSNSCSQECAGCTEACTSCSGGCTSCEGCTGCTGCNGCWGCTDSCSHNSCTSCTGCRGCTYACKAGGCEGCTGCTGCSSCGGSSCSAGNTCQNGCTPGRTMYKALSAGIRSISNEPIQSSEIPEIIKATEGVVV